MADTAIGQWKLQNFDKINRAIKQMGDKFLPALMDEWVIDGNIIISNIIRRQLSGRPGLKRRTGQASRSLFQKTTRSKNDVKQTISFRGRPAKYIPVHEFGAVIKPKTATRLAFMVGGKMIFAKSVKIPKRLHITEYIQTEGLTMRFESLKKVLKEFTK